MKHILEAGTDGACIAVFDAWALPPDFDARSTEDPRQAADDAQEAGQCFYSDTGGDGTHILHAYLDEEVPSALLSHSTQIAETTALLIPSGRLFFTGAEDLCRDDLLEPPPVSSEQWAELPKGSYAARFYEIEVPGEHSHSKSHIGGSELAFEVGAPTVVGAFDLDAWPAGVADRSALRARQHQAVAAQDLADRRPIGQGQLWPAHGCDGEQLLGTPVYFADAVSQRYPAG